MKNKKIILSMNSGRNFGAFTNLSKDLNRLIGDSSGRTISIRTASGFQKIVNPQMSIHDAEDVVHFGMVATSALLSSKNENANKFGMFGGFLLLICYWGGK